ncbi:MAG: molybdenum cofactor guanylyltransferase [Chloroflexi bacterium]|nr:molybdenum cofactor guanylyltransferase [Chloroflexota bacterium]
MVEALSGIVLAGGRGSRLGGVIKALLPLGPMTSLGHVLGALEPLCRATLVVANDSELSAVPGARVVFDPEPHAGVLPALRHGLSHVETPLAVVVACDMPLLSSDLLWALAERVAARDVVIPRVDRRLEPMHAVYRVETSLAAIDLALAAGERRMTSFLDRLRVDIVDEATLRTVDAELRSLFNVNTPEDLAFARRVLGDRGGQAESVDSRVRP